MNNWLKGRGWRLLALVLSLTLGLALPGAAQETAILEGSVVNGSTGQLIAGQTVTLERYEGMTPTDSQTTQSDTQGRFRFEKLPFSDKTIYMARTTYAGVEYSSEMVLFKAGQTTQTAIINVYDLTDDGAGIRIERAHVIVRPTAMGVEIGEMVVISNTGKGAYVGRSAGGGPAQTLRFYLPAGYSQLSFEVGELGGRFLPLKDGFADTLPVRPGVGVEQIIFSYILPAQTGTWQLDYRLAYPAAAVNILVAGGWEVSGAGVTFAGQMGSGEGAFANYRIEGVSADKPLTLTFKPGAGPAGGMLAGGGQPTPSPASYQPTLLLIAAGALILLLALTATYPLWRRRGA